MATRFELVMHGLDPRRLRAAGEEALAEIERLDRRLNAYNPQSDISWINAHAGVEPVKVEGRLFRLLQQSLELHQLTDGAFDITIGPLMHAWGLAQGQGRVPSDDELSEARALVGSDKIILNDSDFTIRFAIDGMRIDLGAIGKGYAIEQAVEILKDHGITSALLHGGTSSIHAIGQNWGQTPILPWRVAIRAKKGDGALFACAPRKKGSVPLFLPDVIDLHDSSLSVSAIHGKSFTTDGINYGHVIDPRTGQPVRSTPQAAVMGPSATVCDALSTALLVLGKGWLPELSVRFAGYHGVASESHR